MTRRTNARIAGIAFLLYIAVALSSMALSSRAAAGQGPAEKLAAIAAHLPFARLALLLDLTSCFCALILAVTLYAITRDVDPDVALGVLVFRSAEGIVGAVSLQREVGRLWLATASGPGGLDAASAQALTAMIMRLPSWSFFISGTLFAAGSTAFCWLLLRGRIVPAWLSWLGLAGSLLALVVLPLEMAGIATGGWTRAIWLPLLVFELVVAVRFIAVGAAAPQPAARRDVP